MCSRPIPATPSPRPGLAELHPDAPERDAILFHTDRVQAITDFGRDYIDFGVYLLRKPG